eukprot:Gb_19172 [translate_table: standard]
MLVGETSSGKTTHISRFVVEIIYTSNCKQIACIQPQRVAKMFILHRVAEEMDVTIREEFGYNIRFEGCNNPKIVLKYLADGMLLREMTSPLLEWYRVIILDEAHERTLETNLFFWTSKGSSKNKKLYVISKLVVMSATLVEENFQSYFNVALLMKVPRILHLVEILYTQEPERDYLEATIKTVVQMHTCEPGDILVFLIREEEIEDECRKEKKITRDI